MDDILKKSNKSVKDSESIVESMFESNDITALIERTTLLPQFSDEDESSSFVILAKDSMDAIQASSLASYIDIKQKSMSIDYDSIISSLDTKEIHQKLTEMLQENIRLKETLKQNDVMIKKQFGVLEMWQKRVIDAHQTNKQKFIETKMLLNQLKQENVELKNALSLQMLLDTKSNLEEINIHVDNSNISNVSDNQTTVKKELLTMNDALNFIKEPDPCDSLIQNRLKKDFSLLDSKFDLYLNSDDFKPDMDEKYKNSEVCLLEKNKIIADLTEKISQLEKKLQYALQPIKLPDIPIFDHFDGPKQKFMCHIKLYNDTLRQLMECFASQTNRLENMEIYLKEIIDIVFMFGNELRNNKKSTENELSKEPDYKQKFMSCYDKLIEDRDKIMNDRQILVNSQNRIQIIFMHCKYILSEMNVENDENFKLKNFYGNISRHYAQKLWETNTIASQEKRLIMEQSSAEEKKVIEREKEYLHLKKEQLKEKLNEEKENVIEEKEKLNEEKEKLNEEKEKLNEEKEKLHEEKEKLNEEKEKLNEEKEKLNEEKEKLNEEKEKLKEKTEKLKEEKEKLQEEKNFLETLKEENKLFKRENLETERQLLQKEMKFLQQEKTSLLGEKISLDHQSKLYECHQKSLQDERKMWQIYQEQLMLEIDNLKQEIKTKNAELASSKQCLTQNADEISLLQAHLLMYKQDYMEEKTLKESLLKEKDMSDAVLMGQIRLCNRLQRQMAERGIFHCDEPMPCESGSLICINCDRPFTDEQTLTEHVEKCLNLE